ncbi:carbon-nitrogen hydrolase family protein [Aestuariivirga sp. YIM B02566]|uniref:Carbon-nitrogen hydrolase family protein n=1 Tax=Taklimakanibacter albus TaxID=2800327 RepID=A0ACC5R6L8_9HYPH|nr:carbon-nitrogen hydrolase family protein [Aestuariivirga sp. YIM B02566]MBK1868146.1 carbon-nitrogen hydrolase family protein [Aestuariivirga sp. YIM B02566]
MSFKAALIQLRSGRDMARNIAEASALIVEAARQGASLVATPEMTNILETDRDRLRGLVRPEAEDASVAAFAELARDKWIWLLAGSFALKGPGARLLNRSLLFAPDGTVVARYDKVHLFDVDLPNGQVLRESAAYAAGHDVPVVPLPFATLGLTICYDVRFPHLYKDLAKRGAEILTVPSAFTKVTGEAHWDVLLKARAIETGSFILAPAQGGLHECGRETYGMSLAVSPWGETIAEGGEVPELVMTTIDRSQVLDARRRIPVLMHDQQVTLNAQGEVAT